MLKIFPVENLTSFAYQYHVTVTPVAWVIIWKIEDSNISDMLQGIYRWKLKNVRFTKFNIKKIAKKYMKCQKIVVKVLSVMLHSQKQNSPNQ